MWICKYQRAYGGFQRCDTFLYQKELLAELGDRVTGHVGVLSHVVLPNWVEYFQVLSQVVHFAVPDEMFPSGLMLTPDLS